MVLDRNKIQRDGVKLIEEFSKMLSGIEETKETHYVVDMKNITRKDKEPVDCKGFRDKLKKNALKWEDGHVVAEKGV